MKTTFALLFAAASLWLASCTNTESTTYYETRTRYVEPSSTLPGHAISLPNPGSPQNFRATSGN